MLSIAFDMSLPDRALPTTTTRQQLVEAKEVPMRLVAFTSTASQLNQVGWWCV